MNPILDAIDRFADELAFDDGKHSVSYHQLKPLLSADPGTRRNQHVAWCPNNEFESFLTFWRLQVAGCVACPVSSRFPDDKREEIVRQLDARWLADSDRTVLETQAEVVEHQEVLSQEVPSQAVANAPATVILSSGSTGLPKAVVHSMRAHVASAVGAATNIPLRPGDRWLWSLPLYHVSGLSILVRCAVAGATVVGVSNASHLNAELLKDQRITHLSVVATQLRRLMESEQFPAPHLKAVLLGGSSVPSVLVDEARARGVAVHTTYGLTEMASQVTTSLATCDPITSGRVLPNRELQVADNGEILVRGETLCLGYYRDGRIVPAVDEDGWFHTRDRGALDEAGQLTVAGRIDNMFISGGENIYPEVIERELLKLPNVEQAIVVPKPDEEFGARPVAFVKGRLSEDWEAELRGALRGLELPTAIHDWPEDAMLGIKPDRKKMTEMARNG